MNGKKIVMAALSASLLLGASAGVSFAAKHDGPRHGPGRGGPPHAMMQEVTFVKLLKAADTDKDGKITAAEMTALEDKLFTGIDANKDGSLTPGEIRTYGKAQMEAFRKDHPRPDKPVDDKTAKADDKDGKPGRDHGKDGPRGEGRHAGPGGRHHGGPMGGMLMRMADADENGQISKAEATAASDKLFKMMDKNGDGVISIDDMPDSPWL
jgi:Ca2+-binding EF-hand superfamily protein